MSIFNKISLIVFVLCVFWFGYSIYGMNANRGLFHTDDFNYKYTLTVKQLTDDQIISIREYLAQYRDIDIPNFVNDYKNYSTPDVISKQKLFIPFDIPLKYEGKSYGSELAPAICGVCAAFGLFSACGINYKE